MLSRLFTLIFLCCISAHAQDAIDPKTVAIVYNSNNPESSKLAFYYAKQREIPQSNLIGLATSDTGKISRAEYIETIQDPLRRHFTANRWWTRNKTSDGFTIPSRTKIRLIVCMYGVPFGINQEKPAEGTDTTKQHVVQRANSASVDSELSMFGIEGIPLQGALPNKYFKQNASFSTIKELTPYVMVGRIDGPSYAICQRLIDDAIATEKRGLWGMCYLDKALKGASYKIGDDWMTNIEKFNWSKGIPTTMDNTKQTYLTNYPMRDASLYFGWYTGSRNGPLLDPDFKFKQGAIAIHLHSFSASNLRNKDSHWVGPILDKGAAATVGNVYEPYLQLTHQFDILNQRLQEGYSFIEAATMSIPYLSWQNVAIGDPLYRPFLHTNGSGDIVEEDKVYRATSIAFKAWKDDIEQITNRLRTAAVQKEDPRFYEILGLWKLFLGDSQAAQSHFYPALTRFTQKSDKIRIALHLANLYRGNNNKAQAISTLKNALIGNVNEPAAKTLQSMLDILQPPAPEPAQPRESAATK